MGDWKPKLTEDIDYQRIDLSGDTGTVFNFIDGFNSLEDISIMTDIPEARVLEIVHDLMDAGAIRDERPSGASADQSADATGDSLGSDFRKIFETELHQLPPDKRASLAKTATGSLLKALCFDPDPKTIKSVLENLQTGLDHARLIANHHRNPVGLDALGTHPRYIRDDQVRRLLLRNVQTPDSVLRKVLASLPLGLVYKLNLSRENSEKAKRLARKTLREKFMRAPAEERTGLVFTTEGRCLNLLLGLTFDSKTTSLLCRRTVHSSLLIQNLARFPGTPPAVIRHLSRQQVVRRTPHLRRLLVQHANCPGDLKRLT